MTRLERKCLIASTGAHAFVVVLLVVVPLLWVTSQPPKISLPVLTFIPSRLVDGATSSGGSPLAKASPAPAPMAPAPVMALPASTPVTPPAPKTQTAPPKSEPKAAPEEKAPTPKVEPRRTGEPVPTTKKTVKTDPDDAADTKPTRRKVEISLTRENKSATQKASAEARREAEANERREAEANARAAQAQYASRVQSIVGAIGQGMSSGTSVEIPGPGGEAFADYGQWVIAIYQRAWSPPGDLADNEATVEATVVISRNGTVESFTVTKNSRHSALNQSVDRLQKVKSIAPFPEGVTDLRRTFIIEFNLRSKKRV